MSRTISTEDVPKVIHHLRVAAQKYRANAESVALPSTAETFREMAEEADRLANDMEEEG